MNILLIGSRTTDEGETAVMAAYAEFFSNSDTDHVSFVHFDELSYALAQNEFAIYDHRNMQELNQYDLIIFRGKVRASAEFAYSVSRYCARHNIRFLNDYTPYRPASKLSQAITFLELGLPFPITVYSSNKTNLLNLIDKEIGYPAIVKSSLGSHGNDNYLAKNREETNNILDESPDIAFIGQSFFKNKCDYRLLCMGDDELVIRRTSSGDTHLNNTSQGGSAELVEKGFLPEQAIHQAHTLTKALKMEIAGVDLLYDELTNHYVFLEVNSQPQLTTGAFPDAKRELLARFLDGYR